MYNKNKPQKETNYLIPSLATEHFKESIASSTSRLYGNVNKHRFNDINTAKTHA